MHNPCHTCSRCSRGGESPVTARLSAGPTPVTGCHRAVTAGGGVVTPPAPATPATPVTLATPATPVTHTTTTQRGTFRGQPSQPSTNNECHACPSFFGAGGAQGARGYSHHPCPPTQLRHATATRHRPRPTVGGTRKITKFHNHSRYPPPHFSSVRLPRTFRDETPRDGTAVTRGRLSVV